MITKFAIKVNEVITCRESGNTGNSEGYAAEYNDRIDILMQTSSPDKFFNTEKEAWDFTETLPVARNAAKFTKKYTFSIEPFVYGYANMHGWTDVNPFEIVRVVSPKTIEIRIMDSEELPWEADWVVGGFAGHCKNQRDQKWKITSNSENPVIKARLRKDGYFHSSHGRHWLAEKPRKFYDYNF